MEALQTRYVRVGGAEVACQIVGKGPLDVVHLRGWEQVDLI